MSAAAEEGDVIMRLTFEHAPDKQQDIARKRDSLCFQENEGRS